MDNFNKDDDYLIVVFIIGFIASILNLDHIDFKKAKYKILSFLLSSLSSMFLCWISYEIFFYFLNTFKVSLALSGFISWRGTEWINSIIDRAINKKLEKE